MHLDNDNNEKLPWTKPVLSIIHIGDTQSGDWAPEEVSTSNGPS